MGTGGRSKENNKWLVLYDGYCTLCSNAVQWIIRNDRLRRFSYKPLQEMQQVLPKENTIILARGEKLYFRSNAVLRIACGLPFPWPLFGVFFIIPPFIRDFLYNIVARKRKKWFGSRSTCYLP